MSKLFDFSVASWRNDPEIRIEDAYKWLFHATQGGEHAITSADGPRRWMNREWKTLTAPRPGEPLLTPLRPDGKLVRLNLRPYRARGGTAEPLLCAFIASAKKFTSDRAAFLTVWKELSERLKAGKIGALTRAEWERLDKEAKAQNYPAIEHSARYEKIRVPAYRVLTGEEAQRLTATLAPKNPL